MRVAMEDAADVSIPGHGEAPVERVQQIVDNAQIRLHPRLDFRPLDLDGHHLTPPLRRPTRRPSSNSCTGRLTPPVTPLRQTR